MSTAKKSHKRVIVYGGIAAGIMFAFCFAMVPLYSLLCKQIGTNTSQQNADLVSRTTLDEGKDAIDMTRSIKVQFIAVNHNGMPWDFYPRLKSIEVHPGEQNKVYFYAKNTTDHQMTVQAIPSMTPTVALNHFHKIECFCFRQQTLGARQSKEMPLVFQIDKDLPKEVRVLTLAYTLFDATSNETKKG
jgi:cytochrome c oxidase assembly protein subunit 11